MDKNYLIGPAARVDGILHLMADEVMAEGAESIKVLLYGAPGVGKTEISNHLAATLTGASPFAVESINGKELDLAKVKEWRHNLRYGNLFAPWDVKIVNEVDKASADAQVLMLTLMDELPARRAIIATSNLQLDLLHERFQTRFMQYKVEAPTTEEIAQVLAKRFPGLRADAYPQIAVGSGGNVRAALADARAAHFAHRHAGKAAMPKDEEPIDFFAA